MSDREAAVRDLWRRRPRDRFARASLVLLLALGAGSWVLGDLDPRGLLGPDTATNLERFLQRVVPAPLRGQSWDAGVLVDWIGSVLAAKGGRAVGATVAISVAAIVLAGALALLLAPLAARTLATPEPYAPGGRRPGLVRHLVWSGVAVTTRALLVVLRALPEYVWAFLLLAIFGPSAWPAVLALAIHNTGILGRLYAETLENAAQAPLAALAGAGATRAGLLVAAALPASFGRLLLYFFYRWETCVREATVLGMLGIVSLGYFIMFDARPRWHYDEMVLLIALGGAIVLAGDLVSAVARALVRRAP